jgi:hypothetical protein
MTQVPTTPCPVCTADLRARSNRHCLSPTCAWRRCHCGTVISPHGLWIAPARSA